MLAERNPGAVYRRIEFDARVTSSDPGQLVHFCYEQVISALGTALFAHDRGDARSKAEALTRATSALTALQLGVTGETRTADALRQLYSASRRWVLDSVIAFEPEKIARIRQDITEIAQALSTAGDAG